MVPMIPVIDKRKTGINLRRLMDLRGITPKDVQQYLSLGCVQSVYRWLDGVSMPTIDNLYALSKMFHVPIDMIVRGNVDTSDYEMISNSSRNRRLFEYYKRLTELNAA